jgi:hypothetical protein
MDAGNNSERLMNFPQHHYEQFHLSQVATVSIPYGFDHTQLIGDKEILYYINCRDGVKIIYVDPNCVYRCYEDDEHDG